MVVGFKPEIHETRVNLHGNLLARKEKAGNEVVGEMNDLIS